VCAGTLGDGPGPREREPFGFGAPRDRRVASTSKRLREPARDRIAADTGNGGTRRVTAHRVMIATGDGAMPRLAADAAGGP